MNRADLLRISQIAAAPVEGDASNPTLDCIVVSAHGGTMQVVGAAPDLSVMVRASALCVEAVAPFAANARIFVDRLRSLPDGDVKIFVDEKQSVTLKCGNRSFRIQGRAASDYPKVTVEEPTAAPFDAALLSELVARGGCATAAEPGAEPIKRAALLVSEAGVTEMGSTDGRRCAAATVTTGLTHAPIMLYRRSVELVSKFVAGYGGKIRLGVADGWMHLSREDGAAMSCRAADVSLSPYRHFLANVEKTPAIDVSVARKQLLDAVRALGSSSDMGQLAVRIEPGRIHLTGRSQDGEAADVIECDSKEVRGFAVSSAIVAMALTAANTERVVLRVPNDPAPIVVREVDGESHAWWMVMPLQPDVYAAMQRGKAAA